MWANELLRQLDDDLHALCQPLTALQVRLEIGQARRNAASLAAAVDGALQEATRCFTAVARIRSRLGMADAVPVARSANEENVTA
jgi:hypothetical protein